MERNADTILEAMASISATTPRLLEIWKAAGA